MAVQAGSDFFKATQVGVADLELRRKLDNATHTVVRDTYNVSDPLVNTGDPFDPVIDPAPASGTDNS